MHINHHSEAIDDDRTYFLPTPVFLLPLKSCRWEYFKQLCSFHFHDILEKHNAVRKKIIFKAIFSMLIEGMIPSTVSKPTFFIKKFQGFSATEN